VAVTFDRFGTESIVLKLDQAIVAGPLLPTAFFSLVGTFNGIQVPIARASYSARFETISLVIAPRFRIHEVARLTVNPAGISNLLGQHLDGNGDGTGGDAFVKIIAI
jgi:hypothetical protein